MALDVAEYIFENWNETTEKKVAGFEDFLSSFGFDISEMDISTKKAEVNSKIKTWFKGRVNGYRKERAEAMAEYTELDGDFS